jgi:hypothetical protein
VILKKNKKILEIFARRVRNTRYCYYTTAYYCCSVERGRDVSGAICCRHLSAARVSTLIEYYWYVLYRRSGIGGTSTSRGPLPIYLLLSEKKKNRQFPLWVRTVSSDGRVCALRIYSSTTPCPKAKSKKQQESEAEARMFHVLAWDDVLTRPPASRPTRNM